MNNESEYFYDARKLQTICSEVLVGRSIESLRWLWTVGTPCFGFQDRIGERVSFNMANVAWTLIDSMSASRIITMSEVGHYEYKAHFDQLVGVKIASVNVDADAGLALRIEFESGLHFQMAPCEQIYDDFERDCWALACGDGYVVLVGGRQGQWKRIRKSEPVYGPPPAEVDGKPNPHLKRRT